MSEDTQQHDAQTRGSLWQIAVALVHLWLTNCYILRHRLPEPSTYYVYDINLGSTGWGRDILRGKRIKVTVEIEDWKR
jgi:hypothetical protein